MQEDIHKLVADALIRTHYSYMRWELVQKDLELWESFSPELKVRHLNGWKDDVKYFSPTLLAQITSIVNLHKLQALTSPVSWIRDMAINMDKK